MGRPHGSISTTWMSFRRCHLAPRGILILASPLSRLTTPCRCWSMPWFTNHRPWSTTASWLFVSICSFVEATKNPAGRSCYRGLQSPKVTRSMLQLCFRRMKKKQSKDKLLRTIDLSFLTASSTIWILMREWSTGISKRRTTGDQSAKFKKQQKWQAWLNQKTEEAKAGRLIFGICWGHHFFLDLFPFVVIICILGCPAGEKGKSRSEKNG